jgi:hypothetical protein
MAQRQRLLVALDQSFSYSISNHAGEQSYRADSVVVSGNGVSHLIGVAVGVEDTDNGDTELGSLVNSEVLLLGVNNPDSRRGLGQVADTTEALVKLDELALLDEEFLLGEAAVSGVFEVELLELLHAGQTLSDGVEVGEQATEPTLVDVGLTNASCLLSDSFLSLLLGSYEEDGSTVSDGLFDEVVRIVDVNQRLLQVDDVNARTLGKHKTLDFRVPTASLVSEVNTAVEQLANSYHGHLHFLMRAEKDTANITCGFVAINRMVSRPSARCASREKQVFADRWDLSC